MWIVTVNACERVGRVSYTQDIVISVAVKVSCEKLVAPDEEFPTQEEQKIILGLVKPKYFVCLCLI